jgi:hypothetical protein
MRGPFRQGSAPSQEARDRLAGLRLAATVTARSTSIRLPGLHLDHNPEVMLTGANRRKSIYEIDCGQR